MTDNSTQNLDEEKETNTSEVKNSFSTFWSNLNSEAKKVAARIEETTKDIINKPQVKEFSHKVQNQVTEIKDKIDSGELEQNLRSGLDQAGKSIDEAVNTVKKTTTQTTNTIAAKTLEWRKEQVIGKFLTIDLKSIDGTTFAKRGDVITRDIINKAEAQNLLENALEYNQVKHPGII